MFDATNLYDNGELVAKKHHFDANNPTLDGNNSSIFDAQSPLLMLEIHLCFHCCSSNQSIFDAQVLHTNFHFMMLETPTVLHV